MPILSYREVLQVTGTYFLPWARGCLRPVMGWRSPGNEVVYFEKDAAQVEALLNQHRGGAFPVLEPEPRTEEERRAAQARADERHRQRADCYALFPRGPGGRKVRRLLRRAHQSARVD